MAKSTTMTGARGLLKRQKADGTMATIALFSDASFSYNVSVQDIFTLGRYEAQELVITSAEPVQINCRGFRVIDTAAQGLTPFGDVGMAAVKDLLNHEDFTIQLEDRQTGKSLVQVVRCRPTALSEDTPAKGVMTFNVSFVGIKMSDETVDNATNVDPGNPSTYPTAQ